MNKEELEKELYSKIYEIRVVIMIETFPQSNKYAQMKLSKEQFKSVSDYISSLLPKTSNGLIALNVSDDIVAELPDSLCTYYLN